MKSIVNRVIFQLIGLGLCVAFGHQTFADNSELSCFEFQSILHFIEKQHLRFETMSVNERASLLDDVLKETPDALMMLGYPMLAARFADLNFQSRFQKENVKTAFERCEVLESSMFRAAFLKAFAKHLDPYSDFYLTEELDAKASALEGEFVGVGIGTEPEEDALKVTEVVPDGPADQKLFIGDRITKIDGHAVLGLNDIEIRQRIRGETGSRVSFEGRRENAKFQVSIVRGLVHQRSVAFSWLENQVLLLKISRFFRQTAQEVETILAKQGPKARGYILDLRSNPGGLLQGARDIVDLFVSQGVVVYLKGRGVEDQVWALHEGGDLKKPIVVLVNGGTASAAEIVAGALQDYGRAVLVGQKTYGKGSVQNIYETQSTLGTQYRGGVKLTTLWYYLPSGRSVRSLTPDVAVASKEQGPKHPAMPYLGPDRIPVSQQMAARPPVVKIDPMLSGSFQDSEEAGRALLKKMLADTPHQVQ